MIIKWLLFGSILSSLIQTFVSEETFTQFFGPSLLGLGLTLVATTIIEVCSEGTTFIAADLLNRANAPGNSFTFLMAGVSEMFRLTRPYLRDGIELCGGGNMRALFFILTLSIGLSVGASTSQEVIITNVYLKGTQLIVENSENEKFYLDHGVKETTSTSHLVAFRRYNSRHIGVINAKGEVILRAPAQEYRVSDQHVALKDQGSVRVVNRSGLTLLHEPYEKAMLGTRVLAFKQNLQVRQRPIERFVLFSIEEGREVLNTFGSQSDFNRSRIALLTKEGQFSHLQVWDNHGELILSEEGVDRFQLSKYLLAYSSHDRGLVMLDNKGSVILEGLKGVSFELGDFLLAYKDSNNFLKVVDRYGDLVHEAPRVHTYCVTYVNSLRFLRDVSITRNKDYWLKAVNDRGDILESTTWRYPETDQDSVCHRR